MRFWIPSKLHLHRLPCVRKRREERALTFLYARQHFDIVCVSTARRKKNKRQEARAFRYILREPQMARLGCRCFTRRVESVESSGRIANFPPGTPLRRGRKNSQTSIKKWANVARMNSPRSMMDVNPIKGRNQSYQRREKYSFNSRGITWRSATWHWHFTSRRLNNSFISFDKRARSAAR